MRSRQSPNKAEPGRARTGISGLQAWGGARGRRRATRISSTSSGAVSTDRMESRRPHRPQTRRCEEELQTRSAEQWRVGSEET